MTASVADLNGRPDERVVVDTNSLPWEPSPAPGVLRKRLHRVGPPESGEVTSLVVYEPGAAFDSHPHPEGEEILVLEGVFSDATGDAHAGTHLLNPEGFEHAPFSKEGCTLFVKLRQYAGAARVQRRTPWGELEYAPGDEDGVESGCLYADARFPDAMRIERWAVGTTIDRTYPQGAELFVLSGCFEEADGARGAGTWLRIPAGDGLRAAVAEACEVYVKEGGVAGLRVTAD